MTMRDVAREAGVHVTTVSLALRRSPQLPASTRKRIQALAQRMGYRPNPLVVALMQGRRFPRPTGYKGSLAFVTRLAGSGGVDRSPMIRALFQGANIRARELGFNLELFELGDFRGNARRLQKVLDARSIRGVIVAPLLEETGVIDFKWESLAAVTIGDSLRWPKLDTVSSDMFAGSWMALEECYRRGYKKPGLVLLKRSDLRTHGRWRGAFMAYPHEKAPLPSLLLDENEEDGDRFRHWEARWRLDVLLGNTISLEICRPLLRQIGRRIPRDVGLLRLNISYAGGRDSGIRTSATERGRLAVNFLAGKLYRNEYGIPRRHQVILSPPAWCEGATLRKGR